MKGKGKERNCLSSAVKVYITFEEEELYFSVGVTCSVLFRVPFPLRLLKKTLK